MEIIHTPCSGTIIRDAKPQIDRRLAHYRVDHNYPPSARFRPHRQNECSDQAPSLLIRSRPSRSLGYRSIREGDRRQISIDSKDIDSRVSACSIPRIGHKVEFNLIGTVAAWDILEGSDEVALVDVVGGLESGKAELTRGREGAETGGLIDELGVFVDLVVVGGWEDGAADARFQRGSAGGKVG